jgi:hypothetical protein
LLGALMLDHNNVFEDIFEAMIVDMGSAKNLPNEFEC